MTRAERHFSVARSSMQAQLVLKGGALSLVAVIVIATAIFSFARTSTADSISGEKAYAAELVAQIQQENDAISALNEQYDQAEIQLQQIDGQITSNQAAVSHSDKAVRSDIGTLRNEALGEYMSGGPNSSIAQLFSGGGYAQSDAQEYLNLAGGNISTAIDQLHVDQQSLAVRRQALNTAESAKKSTLAKLSSERNQAQQEEQKLTDTLSQVRGRIATLVHQQEVAQQKAEERAFQARVAAERAQQLREQQEAAAAAEAAAEAAQAAQTPPEITTTPPSAPPSAGNAGEIAVNAAKTQLGVPYIWGGSTPGVGFDCSGLTMWSWARAGVELPHSAAMQMQVTTPVPLNDLQPGDLLFYYDSPGYVGHVTMYIGPGEMIQAEETGTDIMITPIWYQNLAGAGRP